MTTRMTAVLTGQVLSWLGDAFQVVALPVAIVVAGGSAGQMAAAITATSGGYPTVGALTLMFLLAAVAVEWIADGMAPLGNEYVEQMKKGLTTERWVDYVENEGKRQGAYSTSGGMVKPFIFMTWNDTMFS